MRASLILAAAACSVAAAGASSASAAITITPGADTVSTPRLDLDFGDAAANVERLDSVRWRDSTGLQGGNLAADDGPGGCDTPASAFHWAEAGSANGPRPPPRSPGTGRSTRWSSRPAPRRATS